MKAIILDLASGSERRANTLSTSVSFQKIVGFIKQAAKTESPVKQLYIEKAIEALTADSDFLKIKTIDQTTKFKSQLRIIYDMLTPSLQENEEKVWALGIPLSPVLFYGTDAFYNMAMNPVTYERRSELITDPVVFSEKDKILNVYALIFERIYAIKTPNQKPLIITIKDSNTQIPRYFRINIDHRFTDVRTIGKLPEINPNQIYEFLTGNGDIQQLVRLVPLNLFHFEGISIITLADITAEYTLENLKSIVLDKEDISKETFYGRICDAFRILLSDPGLEFGFIPQLKVNNKAVLDYVTTFHSINHPVFFHDCNLAEIYILFASHFEQYPGSIILAENHLNNSLTKFWTAIKNAGVLSYAVLPIFNGLKLAGLLEIYSARENAFNEQHLSRINPANNLLSRIFQNIIDEFDSKIKTVIREKFTSIQQPVQWKFEQAAWHSLRDNSLSASEETEEINFKNVYPIYGAIDIRNSTIARNDALSQDLQLQLKMLITLLMDVDLKSDSCLTSQLAFRCNKMLMEVIEGDNNLDETVLNEFFNTEVHPYLRQFTGVDKETKSLFTAQDNTLQDQIQQLILDYFENIIPESGIVYKNRRELEKSIKMINSCVNNALDDFKNQVQTLYPAYFEKFRTDGVEYDIYIGQSINPEKKFRQIHLKKVKQIQLDTMASIARQTIALLPSMKKHLVTTQLIFIHSNTINITFRDDERRFDVEGASNIRYQVIKKRIDKAQLKNTGERLTQPGKIALVYFQNKAIRDYLEYINFLQSQSVLADDLEFLELDELQGVSGLKALRVSVVMEYSTI